MPQGPDLISAANAADILANAVPPRSASEWTQWLANNRNAARRAGYRVPYERLGGRVYYRRSELEGFIQFQGQRLLGNIELKGRVAEIVQAYGLGQPKASGHGRPFNLSQVAAQVDHFGGDYVQLVLSDPLTVYRLSPKQCEQLQAALDHALQDIAARRSGGQDNG